MSKRSRESNEDRWRRKIKDYEEKLARTKRRRVIYSSGSDTDDVQIQEHLNNDATELEVLEPHIPIMAEPATSSPSQNEQLQSTSTEPMPITSTEPMPITSTEPMPSTSAEPMPTSSTATPSSLSVPVPAVDPELLLALGDSFMDVPEWGEDILQDISQRWEPIFKQGLTKEVKEELLKKYLFPKNAPLTKPPILNPEISTMLTEACRNRDSRVCSKQSQIGHAIAALGKAMTGILTKSMKSSEVVRILNDAGKLFADSHFLETDTRRSLITPLLDKSYVAPFKDRQRDNFLFGGNLGEFIKSSRGIKKTGQLIAPPAPSTSSTNLNWTGPPRQLRVSRPPAQRGGQRAAAARSVQPPPPPRRAPAPPRPAPRRAPAPSRQPAAAPASRSRRTT